MTELRTDSNNVGPSPTATPLLLAINHGHLSAVSTLLKCGANPNMPEAPPLFAAIAHAFSDPSSIPLIPLLLSHGANPNHITVTSANPVSTTLGHGRSKTTALILSHLLESGASIHTPGSNGLSPLEHAAGFKNPEAFAILLDHGARTYMHPEYVAQGMKADTGAYALYCAVAGGMRDMVERVVRESDTEMWTERSVRSLMVAAVGTAVVGGDRNCLEAVLLTRSARKERQGWQKEVNDGKMMVVKEVLENEEIWTADRECVRILSNACEGELEKTTWKDKVLQWADEHGWGDWTSKVRKAPTYRDGTRAEGSGPGAASGRSTQTCKDLKS